MRKLLVYLIALVLWLCSAIPVMASPVATSSATTESPHELRLFPLTECNDLSTMIIGAPHRRVVLSKACP